MVKALETLPWLNTQEDIERLEIAKEILKERRTKCKGCGEGVLRDQLSHIDLCPTCSEEWVKAATS